MRDVFRLSALCLAAAVAMAGCKIVPDPDPGEAASAASGQTDEARMEAYAQEIWQPKVLPVIQENLVPLAELRSALAADANAAGQQHGLRPEGEANPWNFAVSGEGRIVEAKLDSRAAKLGVDTTGDGAADVTVQLGPVIRGTALRDAMPFIVFTDFRDQIEFAKLANALNAAAHAAIAKPGGDVIGQTARFEGVFTLRDPAKIELVPTMLKVGG
ncbi:DUF2291 family protein [Paracoccus alkanivorans]|uniref:DUF2291 family protein n=1 Tax=Paracoccus alkanivorans TaxID=2116655 RepID=A0A3M0MJF1_9RHOB|nr:DUF2291 domain-containing protein [Paracoccus alkanivorans]RMC37739.1 DUF2291 family protein [Paracoccus alkanivorans]